MQGYNIARVATPPPKLTGILNVISFPRYFPIAARPRGFFLRRNQCDDRVARTLCDRVN